MNVRLRDLFVSLLIVSGACAPSQPLPQPTESKSSSAPAGEALPHATVKSAKAAADWSANEILAQLLTTYRQAKTYQDQAVVRLAFRENGQPVSQEWPTAVALVRPNKLSLVAYQAMVKIDGKELKAKIDDPETNNVDGQFVVQPAPAELKLAHLARDKVLDDMINSRLRRPPIQLELLLDSGGLVSAFGSDLACRRLDDERYDGRMCFRVEVPSPGGPFVFWVDQSDLLLRRLDYPAAALVPDLASDPAISDVQLLADLRGAKIGREIPAASFALDIPAEAKRMKSFVIPPRPLPSSLFGQQPREFSFTSLDGQRVRDRDLEGKIAVLAWYHDNPACEATLQQVSLAQQRLKNDAAAVFYAVATDPVALSNEALKRRLVEWKVDLPIVRDLEAFGDKSFQIEVQPTIVVLDKQGQVQIFQAGGNPQLGEQLVEIVGRLKNGDNLASELVARDERDQREYEQLVARGGPEPGELLEIPEAVIRRRNEPKKLTLTPLWTNRQLKLPGNIVLAGPASGESTIFVVEGWRTIAEVDAAGKIVSRHALELPEAAAVTYLRRATDKTGRRHFVASAPLAPQFFVFDDQWNLKLAWPSAEEAPLSLVDLALADIGETDGVPEILAASVDDIGLMALSLEGQVQWRNRAFANAVSIAVSRPDDVGSWGIYVTGERGAVLRVNRFGKEEPPVTVGTWPILRVFAEQSAGGKQAALLGLSNNAKGEMFAVGLTSQLKESWNYPLPVGVHVRPIEPVRSSQLFAGHAGEWWLAGPDGSVHVITEDGNLFDSFHTGVALTGIAAGKLGGKSVLLVASDDGLTAWEVAAPQPAAKGKER
jgi:peroxiredoxin